jgi:hypothetical protein
MSRRQNRLPKAAGDGKFSTLEELLREKHGRAMLAATELQQVQLSESAVAQRPMLTRSIAAAARTADAHTQRLQLDGEGSAQKGQAKRRRK